ncbi:hypothetical protein BZA05DRAFT_400326 [Tricharina praecox]|uniref:uncharacterized protein n=1 Tax=Tricharina praecox TaxID=43433 RepID=UPI00221E5C0C|nr:uncharacterized protein BZA05DRAFT_400326 [Tricharina praecox]KAI5849936.1 hypothetical protein BZA05DRAFT_400326 [Tricharina praecox]
MANLPIDEFFGSETATQVVTQPVFFAAPTPTSSCGSKDEFNVINDVKFADSGFFKAKRSLGGLTRGAFGGMDEFNVINSVTFADREQQQFNNPCNYGCNPCYGQCRPNGKPKGAVAQNSSSQSSNRNRCAGDRFNNAEHSKQHSKRQMMDCSSDNQNIVQSIQNNQNVDAEILGNTGFANTRSFLSFLNKRDVGLIKGSPLARRNYQHNPTKNININKNLNKPQPPPCPVEITTTEYVPVVEKIPVAVPVTTPLPRASLHRS